ADPVAVDALTYSWSVTKNGNPFPLPVGTPTNKLNFTFTPDDNGSYVVTLTATDAANHFGTDFKTITVTNVAPTVQIGNVPAAPLNGVPIHLTSAVSDPSTADVAAGFTYVWKVVSANGEVVPGGTGATFDFTPHDGGAYLVALTVKDKDGGAGPAPAGPTGH